MNQTSSKSQDSLNHPTIKSPWWNPIAQHAKTPMMIIFGLLLIRVVWQYLSPYTLIEDEAHYWEWSRRLDWSYYSKGPGVSWTIWASTQILGHAEWAIRVPAAIAAALGSWAVLKMARDHLDDQRTVFLSTVLYACVPGFAVASMIMSIDSPYIACWAWASYFALRAILTDQIKIHNRAWMYFGLCVGIGFLYKYTILLIFPGVFFTLFVTRSTRIKLNLKWMILGSMLALLGLIPVAIWNSQHDWATIRHLLGHLGAPGGDTRTESSHGKEPWTILWMLEFIALQFLVGGPVLVLGVFAWINSKKRATPRTQLVIRAMLAMGFPLLGFYFFVSLIAQTEGNWPMAAFVTLIPPAAWAILDGVERVDHPVKFAWGAALTIGIGVLLLFPGASWLANRPGIGHLIPLERMNGMREHALHAQEIVDELRESTGLEPIVMSEHYGRASLLAYYLRDQPIVYCTSSQVGGRKTQYDMWTETDLSDPQTREQLLGRPGVLFGGAPRQWTPAFDQLKDLGSLRAEPKEGQSTYTGMNFHTFDTWVPKHKHNQQP